MTRKQLNEKINNGGCLLLIGEYRGSALENRKFRDKTNGNQRQILMMRHSVECVHNNDLVTYHVKEYFETEADVKPLPFPRGTIVAGEPSKIENEGGVSLLTLKTRLQEVKD